MILILRSGEIIVMEAPVCIRHLLVDSSPRIGLRDHNKWGPDPVRKAGAQRYEQPHPWALAVPGTLPASCAHALLTGLGAREPGDARSRLPGKGSAPILRVPGGWLTLGKLTLRHSYKQH